MITVKKEEFRVLFEQDDSADVSLIEEIGEERLSALRAGQWHFIVLRARVDVEVALPLRGNLWVPIWSSGVWGIESDASQDYLDEVFAEEREELAAILTALGVQVL